jgi:tetratricopeptide (TPR) repeat protein
VLVKQIAALQRGGARAACADLALRETQRALLGQTNAVADFAGFADECADALDHERARLLRARLSEAIRQVVESPDSALSMDDTADALRVLREISDELGDTKTARAYAVRERDLLDRAEAQATTPYARLTYSSLRTEVYIYLGEAEDLVEDLEKSVQELPREYDPPYRLAWVYLKIGRPDDALASAKRALGLAYGPRRGRVLETIADIQEAREDIPGERAARQAVVDFYAAAGPGEGNARALAEAKADLAKVGQEKKKN